MMIIKERLCFSMLMRFDLRQTNNCCAASRNLDALSNIIIDFHHIANRDKRKIIASMAVNVIISIRLRRKNELSWIHHFYLSFVTTVLII